MNAHFDWMVMLPEMVITAGGVLILLLDAIAPSLRRSFTALAVLVTLAGGYAAYYVTPLHHAVAQGAGTFNGLIETSPLTLAFTAFILVATVLSLLASQGYLRREGILTGEYHALLLWCAVGLLLMLWIGVAPNTFLQPSRQALESVLADYRQRVEEPDVRQASLRPATTAVATEAGR